jgi:arginine utilization protein RocB
MAVINLDAEAALVDVLRADSKSAVPTLSTADADMAARSNTASVLRGRGAKILESNKRLLTQQEVAERLRVKAAVVTFKRWREKNFGPPWFRIGRQWLCQQGDLEDWIAARRDETR